MNILMMTNTYLPHVGGVANSVSIFTKELRNRDHRVIVVAPEYEEEIEDEKDIIRMPAIQHFNGSDFSMVLPIPNFLEDHLQDFKPDIVHSNHPFLIGSTAARISTKYNIPLVYTQHTMYEEYTHYVPVGLKRLKQFVISLSTGYANISNMVIAPSESIAEIIKERGVIIPVEIVPTGVYTDKFTKGQGLDFRDANKIHPGVFVIGHVGRLAPEKNLEYLSKAVGLFLQKEPETHIVVVGYGSSEEQMKEYFIQKELKDRVHFIGKLIGNELIDAYHAMDVFAFSSKSETQGLVLVEAMAAGVPVIALNAPGVREVVRDGVNGFLLSEQDAEYFSNAISRFFSMSGKKREYMKIKAKKTAEKFSVDNCVSKLIKVYKNLNKKNMTEGETDHSILEKSIEQIKTEWELLSNITNAVGDAIQNNGDKE